MDKERTECLPPDWREDLDMMWVVVWKAAGSLAEQ
jgi:hypothetical protein